MLTLPLGQLLDSSCNVVQQSFDPLLPDRCVATIHPAQRTSQGANAKPFRMRKIMRGLQTRCLAIAFLCCAGLSAAVAQSTLHIGPGSGTPCATGCAGDPNLLDGALNIDIYQTSNGAPTLSQPVLIIFGVPSEY